MRKLLNIQALRGISACMVAGFHVVYYYFTSPVNLPRPHWTHYGSAGVDLFFVISGFIMVYVNHERFGSLRHQLDFLFDRVTRIYPTYWIATVPIVAIGLLLGQEAANRPLSPQILLTSLVLWPTEAGFPLLRIGWSLIHEVYFYAVFSFFLLGRCAALPFKLLGWAAIVMIFRLSLPAAWYQIPFLRLVFNPFTLEFIAGALLALTVWSTSWKRWGPWMMAGGFVLLMGGTLVMPDPSSATSDWRPLFLGVPSLLIVGGAVIMEGSGQRLQWSVFQRLGDASFQIYLWHNTVIALVWRALLAVDIPNELRLILSLGCGLAAGYVAHLYIERPLLRWVRGWRKTPALQG